MALLSLTSSPWLGLDPEFANYLLCDLRRVPFPFWASFPFCVAGEGKGPLFYFNDL